MYQNLSLYILSQSLREYQLEVICKIEHHLFGVILLCSNKTLKMVPASICMTTTHNSDMILWKEICENLNAVTTTHVQYLFHCLKSQFN